MKAPDCGAASGSPAAAPREAVQTLLFRGRRSRNKVSVGEPAEGSLSFLHPHPVYRSRLLCSRARSLHGRCSDEWWHGRARAGRTLLRQTSALVAPVGASALPRAHAGARLFVRRRRSSLTKNHTTLAGGYLGSLNDEERSEMRYLM